MSKQRATFSQALNLIAGAETLDRLLGEVEFGLYIDTPESGCVFASDRLLEQLGLTWEEFAGFGWAASVHPEDALGLQEVVHQHTLEKQLLEYRFRIRRPNGEVRWLSSKARAVTDANGKHVGNIAMTLDVTDEEQLRERSVTAQKLEAVGRLAGRVAHDFNNLLTSILMSAGILGDTVKEGDGREAVRVIEQAVEHATAVTEQLLLLSSHHVSSSKTCLLDVELRKLGSLLSRTLGERIHLVMDLEADEARIPLGRSELGQIVVNLATNARDALTGQGRVEIRTRVDDSHARIEVQDEGIGMSAEVLARVREPFFTTKAPGRGTGLGLATSNDIIVRAGGTLDIESTPGTGTRCIAHLPMIAAAPEVEVKKEQPDLGGVRILLVEDDDALRQSFAVALSTRGMTVDVARDLKSAREQLHANDYDALVSDVLLPDGSSVGLVEEIRASRSTVRVVFISGYAGEDAEHISSDECTGFLKKPFGPVDLMRAVDKLFAE